MDSHTLLFIQDLAILMIIAGLMTVLCHRFKQPIVFGYIVAGMIIGPYTPPFSFINDTETIETLAQLGVIFLMFSLGLDFSLSKLSKVGMPAFVAALAEIVLMLWIGYMIGHLFQWTEINSIFLGALLSISSTTIIVKALEELRMKREPFAQLIFGILVIEDIFAILILTILSSIVITGSLNIADVIHITSRLASFLVVSLLSGILIIPRMLAYVARFKSNEMLLISVLGLCFGYCLIVVKLQYSVALGAFLIGAIIAESKQLDSIERLINPIRDMFSAIFFVSVGLLFDPHVLITYMFPILVITIGVIIGKVLSCSIGVLLTGRDSKTAVRVGLGLAQIGEFSFIIAALGITLKVTSDYLYSIAVAVSTITTFLTPYLIKHSNSFANFILPLMPARLTTLFRGYKSWLHNIEADKNHVEHTREIKNNLFQIVINLFVVIAIFLVGAYTVNTDLSDILIKDTPDAIQNTIIWSCVFILSLPFLIAVYRRTKAVTRVLVGRMQKPRNAKTKKHMIEIVPILVMFVILIFAYILNASILPPIWLLTIMLVAVGIVIALFFRWFVKLHTRLQTKIIKTFKK